MSEVQAKLKALEALRQEQDYYRTRLTEARALANSLPYLAIRGADGRERPVGARLEGRTWYQPVAGETAVAPLGTRAEIVIDSPGEPFVITPAEARRLASFLFDLAEEAETFNREGRHAPPT